MDLADFTPTLHPCALTPSVECYVAAHASLDALRAERAAFASDHAVFLSRL